MLLKQYLKNFAYIIFKHLMRYESIETRIKEMKVPKFLNKVVCYCYNLWWKETQNYNPQFYAEYQKRYWNTIGQYRWEDSHHFDYSDIIENLHAFVGGKDLTLLELGCGKGDMLADINRMFPNIQTFGVDASEKMCEKARKRSPLSTITCGYYGPEAPPPL